MNTKVTKTVEHDDGTVDILFDELGEAELTNSEEAMIGWFNELGKLGNEIEICIYRDEVKGSGSRSMPFLFSFAPEDHTMTSLCNFVLSEYGSGNYRWKDKS